MKLKYPLVNSETINALRDLGEDGDSTFLLEMIDLFFKHAVPLSREVIELLKGHNLPELKSKIHALKSHVANFGAMDLAAICQTIEKEAVTGVYKPTPEVTRLFSDAFAIMAKELEAIKEAEQIRAA